MKLNSLSLLSLLAVTACAQYSGPKFTARLGSAPALSGGTYTSGGGITVAADVRERDGRTLVCGVWAQSRNQSILTKGAARDVVSSGGIFLGREQVARGLSFLPEVSPQDDYSGAAAVCQMTDRPWQAGDEARDVTIRIPRQEVYRDGDGVSGGAIVIFVPSGPGAI